MTTESINQYQPVSETTLYILISLYQEPKHGYAIKLDVRDLSEGQIDLGTGTLYGAIKRLLEYGWIERVEDDVDEVDGRARKYYRLTNLGRKVLSMEQARLKTLLESMNRKLIGESS